MSPGTAQLLKVLETSAYWTSLIPLVVGVIRFRRCSWGLRTLILLAVFAVSTDFMAEIFRGQVKFTCMLPRVYTAVEFTLISLFFLSQVRQRSFRLIIIVVNALFIGLVIADYGMQGSMKIDDLPTGIESIILLLYSLVVLYFVMRDMIYPNLLSTPQFWIIAGIMVYFGGNIFVFVSSNYVANISRDMFDQIWGINLAMTIAYSILISIGLWKARKQYQ